MEGGGQVDENVFLNIPYDNSLIEIFLAYLAGLVALGLYPRVALEVTGGERRLDRTLNLIAECRYSVHELSPIANARKKASSPRLNMAFELGLAVALDRAKPGGHTWFVFADRRASFDRSLSDLAGTDAFFHRRRIEGVFRELSNAFVDSKNHATVQDMRTLYRTLLEGLPKLMRRAGARSPYAARVFSDLRVLARAIPDTAP